MTAPAAPHRERVTCKSCSFLLGRLNKRHDQIMLESGVTMFLVFAAARADIPCPGCGTCRSIWFNRIGTATVQPVIHSPRESAEPIRQSMKCRTGR